LGTKSFEKKLQFTYKKTRLKPGKSPEERIQVEFVDYYKSLLDRASKNELHVVFYDPVHQLHNTINDKCWQRKGGENTLVLESNTGRKRVTVLGALNPLNLNFTSITLTGMVDKEVTKVVLKNLRDTYPDKKEIVVILDNAAYNRAYAVQEYAAELNITLKYLPPYSPNLNLIERVWKFLKKKLKNKYIEKFEDFLLWINNFCKNFEDYHPEIRKIISNKIQIIKAA